MDRWQLLKEPDTWVTFSADGYLTLVEADSASTFDVFFDVLGRQWGPLRVDPGQHQWSISQGQNKRVADVQVIRVELIG